MKQEIEIHDMWTAGGMLFMYPDWEDCCEAIGRGPDKTEEEAEMLSRMFRQLVVNVNSGKIYTLPVDNYYAFDRNAAADSHGCIYSAVIGEVYVIKLVPADMEMSLLPISQIRESVAVNDEGLVFAGSSEGFEAIFPDGHL